MPSVGRLAHTMHKPVSEMMVMWRECHEESDCYRVVMLLPSALDLKKKIKPASVQAVQAVFFFFRLILFHLV